MKVEVASKSLDAVVLFVVDVSLFSAFRKVKSEDIKDAKGVDLKPDDVLTLGSQRVFDKKNLNVFNRLRDQMHRVCMKFGTPFLSGYAIPDKRADEAAQELDKLVAEAQAEKTALLANYDAHLDDFCRNNPQWEKQIRAKAFSKAYIDDRVGFRYHAMRVSAARDEGSMATGMDSQVGGLLGNLLRDIAEVAEDLQKESLTGRQKVTRKAMRPLKAARDKLLGFTFLDPRVQAVADMIDTVCAALPQDGPIEGADLAMLWGITGMLADPRKVMAVAESYKPDGANEFLNSLRPAPLVVAPAVPEAATTPVATLDTAHAMAVILPDVVTHQAADPFGGLFPQPETVADVMPMLSQSDTDFEGLFGV